MNETSRALAAEYVRNAQWDDLNRLLRHIDEEIRQAAAAVCAGFASQETLDISPAVDSLAKALSDDEEVAKEAAFALTWHHALRGEWERVSGLLAHERPLVRQVTAYALGNAAQESTDLSPAVSALESGFADDSKAVVYCTVRALVCHYANRDSASDLQALSKHDDPTVSKLATSLLAEMLCTSAGAGNLEAVRTWLAVGADADGRNDDGETPLVVAAPRGHTGVVEALLDKGAAPDVLDGAGRTALMHAAYQGHEDVVRLLLDGGADMNLESESEFTALDYAAKGSETAIARLLHDKGARMGDKNSVLNLACSSGDTDVVKLVLAHRPDLAFQDANGFTGLMYAAMQGHGEIVEALLAAGADPNVAREGATALTYAKRSEHDDVAESLESHGAEAPE